MVAESLDLILDFIRVDLIIGFGWYSILFFVLRWFKYQNTLLAEYDKYACKTVVFLGILFIIVWLTLVIFNYFGVLTDAEKTVFLQRLTGPYGLAFFCQPLFWLILTQLLRIRFVKRFLLFRILIVIPFILTFERFVIIVTSFHRDYLPSSWYFGFTWWEFLISAIIKAVEFTIIVFILKYDKQKILNLKQAKNF